jgi:hypothetical protein
LGQEVPLVDLRDAFGHENPHYLLTMMTAAQPEIDKQQFIDFLSTHWPQSEIILTGPQFLKCDEIKLPANARIMQSIQCFIDFLNQLSVGSDQKVNNL